MGKALLSEKLIRQFAAECNQCKVCENACHTKICISDTVLALKALDEGEDWKEVRGWLTENCKNTNEKTPDACEGCGLCEDVCPKYLPIRALLESARRQLGL